MQERLRVQRIPSTHHHTQYVNAAVKMHPCYTQVLPTLALAVLNLQAT